LINRRAERVQYVHKVADSHGAAFHEIFTQEKWPDDERADDKVGRLGEFQRVQDDMQK
jgi:hypothetical protein